MPISLKQAEVNKANTILLEPGRLEETKRLLIKAIDEAINAQYNSSTDKLTIRIGLGNSQILAQAIVDDVATQYDGWILVLNWSATALDQVDILVNQNKRAIVRSELQADITRLMREAQERDNNFHAEKERVHAEYNKKVKDNIALMTPSLEMRLLMEEKAAKYGMTITWSPTEISCGTIKGNTDGRLSQIIGKPTLEDLDRSIMAIYKQRTFIIRLFGLMFGYLLYYRWAAKEKRRELRALPARRRSEEEEGFQKEYMPEVDKVLGEG